MARRWEPREFMLNSLVAQAPRMLKSQDKTGRFGSKPWICRDQHAIYTLAAAWAIEDEANPRYHNPELLKAIMDGGDVLIEEADEKGRWIFRKKDNSTWGMIYMLWTYSRWIRTFLLVRDAMPADRRARWERALRLGYGGIAKTCLRHVHNIPTHHAMGLYAAGVAFGRDDWKEQAKAFMAKVVAKQSPAGYWSEHFGPVVLYNFVYSESLGVYYSMSKDPLVLDALRRAAIFHANFTYPDGSPVETIDERNWYHKRIRLGNVGFAFTPEGRGYLLRVAALQREKSDHIHADHAATMLLYGATGDAAPVAGERDEYSFVLGDGDALVLRRKPWFLCLSAFACVPDKSRWRQDRHNYVSLYHDDLGVFAGGGNTKLQPLLSTFTVGDPSLLKHTPGDENPNFLPDIDLLWYATDAKLLTDGLDLTYGEESCTVRVTPHGAKRVTLTFESTCKSGKRVEAHLPFLRGHGSLRSASGDRARLGAKPFELSAQKAGGSVRYGKLRISMPEGSRLVWPALLHNPYKKDGRTDYHSGRLVLCVPLSANQPRAEVQLALVEDPPFPGKVFETNQLKVLDSSDRHTRYLENEKTQFFKALQPGDAITFEVNVDKAGEYDVYSQFTIFPAYGQVRLSVDGQPFERVFDAYCDELDKSDPVLFGSRELTAGPHQFRYEIVGRNPKAQRCYIGIDRIMLGPVR